MLLPSTPALAPCVALTVALDNVDAAARALADVLGAALRLVLLAGERRVPPDHAAPASAVKIPSFKAAYNTRPVALLKAGEIAWYRLSPRGRWFEMRPGVVFKAGCFAWQVAALE